MPEPNPQHQTIRAWYLETFAGGADLSGKQLRKHLLDTLRRLSTLESTIGEAEEPA